MKPGDKDVSFPDRQADKRKRAIKSNANNIFSVFITLNKDIEKPPRKNMIYFG
jgi:hypothetical protein